MEKRILGNTGMEITRVGFGAWAIGGGDWAFGWGDQDDRESVAAIQRAIDTGINWIDTAAVYGLGHSEELVCKALKGTGNKPFIFTKCGLVWDETRRTRQYIKGNSIRKECEDSLRRLGVDVIDLYQIHWPVDEDLAEAWTMMARLQAEGKVKFIGVSNFNREQIKTCLSIAPVSSLQPPYSLLNREYETDTLPFCLENNIGVIVYSPMGAGMLSGAMTRERVTGFPSNDWRRNSSYFKEPALTRNLELAEILKTIGKKYQRSAGEVAIAWTLQNPAVTAAIVGGRSAAQVEGTCHAAEIILAEEDISEITAWLQRS